MSAAITSRAMLILGTLTAIALIGAVYLQGTGNDATVAWTTAGTGVGAFAGTLIPRGSRGD